MKYILMMNTMKLNSPAFPGWSEKDIQGHIAFMIGFCKELSDGGPAGVGGRPVFPRPG